MTIALAKSAPKPVRKGLHVLVRDENHLIFTHDRLFAMVWQVETTAQAVNQAIELVDEFARALTPARFVLLTIIEAKANLPGSAPRAGLAKLLRTHTPHLIRSAVGYEGTGFRAAAFRGVATSIAVLSNHQFPHQVFAGADTAVEWLAAGLTAEFGVVTKKETLARAVGEARQLSWRF